MSLYHHHIHEHTPQNPNAVHAQELAASNFNTRLAVTITQLVSNMTTAYIFTFLAFVGLFGLLGWLNPFMFLLATWLSQQFLQLVFLPILSVGQGVIGRKQELLAEETHLSVDHILHDVEESRNHLDKQDEKILTIEQQNAQQLKLIRQMHTTLQEETRSVHTELVNRDDAMAVLLVNVQATLQEMQTWHIAQTRPLSEDIKQTALLNNALPVQHWS